MFIDKHQYYTLIIYSLSQNSKLVKEYQEDEDRTDKLNQEKIDTEETVPSRFPSW